jgi:WhiB family redox-sensing transcriptional regulator
MKEQRLDGLNETWWVEEAACRGSKANFFPVPGDPPTEAFKICSECPVRVPCLVYAIKRPSLKGIWGGASERQRVRIRRTGLTDLYGYNDIETTTRYYKGRDGFYYPTDKI